MRNVLILISVVLLAGCQSPSTDVSAGGYGKGVDTSVELHFALDQLGQPTAAPEMLEPEIISTSMFERDFALSPDGTELFYTVQFPDRSQKIMHSRKTEAGWSEPVIAAFNDEYNALEPFFHPDGNTLFIVSNRPVNGENRGFDIYRLNRTENGWSAPENIGPAVNTEKNEFYPSVTSDGAMFFCANYDGNEDLYRSELVDGEYQEPQRLGAPLNTEYMEFNAFVAPDESFIVFSSYGREDGFGGGDLYISRKSETGEWLPAENMGARVNSTALDFCPFIAHDGSYFIFTSRRSEAMDFHTMREMRNWHQSPGNGHGDLFIIEWPVREE